MSYELIPLQEVIGDRIAEVRQTEDADELQALWQFEPVGSTDSGDLVYMLCTERLLGCLQYKPDPCPQMYTGKDYYYYKSKYHEKKDGGERIPAAYAHYVDKSGVEGVDDQNGFAKVNLDTKADSVQDVISENPSEMVYGGLQEI